MDKFHHKLPRDDLKKLAKDISKKLVASDYKHKRVEDPTSISAKQEKKVRKYVRDFFDRALEKYRDHEKKKAAQLGSRDAKTLQDSDSTGASKAPELVGKDDVVMSDAEDEGSPNSSPDRKRKRDEDAESADETPSETPSVKRIKEEDGQVPAPPPPPPPPEGTVDTPLSEEERSMREQEEALMRENEEAQRLEDEEQHKKLGGTDLSKEKQAPHPGSGDSKLNIQNVAANGGVIANGTGEMQVDETDDGQSRKAEEVRQHEVLSH